MEILIGIYIAAAFMAVLYVSLVIRDDGATVGQLIGMAVWSLFPVLNLIPAIGLVVDYAPKFMNKQVFKGKRN